MLFRSAKEAIRKLIRATVPRHTVSMSSSSAAAGTGRKGVLIFLHGLGDEGSSWHMQLAPMLPPHIKCICPTAERQAVTLNSGMECNSWFDLRSLDPNDREDEAGIEASTKRIHKLIGDQEKEGVPSDRIVLGGFSQGGALALYAGLSYPKRLAGIVALSCWLPLHAKFPGACEESNRTIPVLQCHGDLDFVVPYQWGQLSASIMSKFLPAATFKTYRGLSHSSSSAELADVVEHIAKQVPK